MSVTSERIQSHLAHPRVRPPSGNHVRIAMYIVTFIVAALAIHQLVGFVIHWGQIRLDDIRYGRPRAMHLEGFVGHDEHTGLPTHFIALNMERQVVVLELPGGDASKVRTLPGPYLFGDDQELTPVVLALQDMDHDNLADLLINVRNEQLVYLNRDGFFRLPTPEEQGRLFKEQGP